MRGNYANRDIMMLLVSSCIGSLVVALVAVVIFLAIRNRKNKMSKKSNIITAIICTSILSIIIFGTIVLMGNEHPPTTISGIYSFDNHGDIDVTNGTFSVKIVENQINLLDYLVKITSINDTYNLDINLSTNQDFGYEGDVITYSNETWIPKLNTSYGIKIIHIEDNDIVYEEKILT